eukprot:5603325-Amphidinium_carterae.1
MTLAARSAPGALMTGGRRAPSSSTVLEQSRSTTLSSPATLIPAWLGVTAQHGNKKHMSTFSSSQDIIWA